MGIMIRSIVVWEVAPLSESVILTMHIAFAAIFRIEILSHCDGVY